MWDHISWNLSLLYEFPHYDVSLLLHPTEVPIFRQKPMFRMLSCPHQFTSQVYHAWAEDYLLIHNWNINWLLVSMFFLNCTWILKRERKVVIWRNNSLMGILSPKAIRQVRREYVGLEGREWMRTSKTIHNTWDGQLFTLWNSDLLYFTSL